MPHACRIGGMSLPEIQPQERTVEQIRYLCRVIDDGHFSIDLKWPSVMDALSHALDLGRDQVAEALKQANAGFTDDPDALFLVAGVFDANLETGVKEEIFQRILLKIGENLQLRNLLVLISSGYDFALALLEFLIRVEGDTLSDFKDNPYLAVITSDLFIESRTSNKFVKNEIKHLTVDFDRIRSHIGSDWFIDLLTILKSGISVNQNRGFQRLVEKESKKSSAMEIYRLLGDGTLNMIVLHRNRVMKQPFVSEAFSRRYEMERHEERLRIFYYWLGIANDFVLGVLFLLGSIEFFPNGNQFLGVIMFVIGSAQLVARSVIQIVMNIHIRSHRKRKLSELLNRT